MYVFICFVECVTKSKNYLFVFTEEDIIVLQGVQKQLENEDHSISRQWQTDWPADHYNSGNIPA
jgi:hypothetical protein